jgi:hypothetical protein
MSPIWGGGTLLQFECGIFSMRSKVVHHCSYLCVPRFESTILSITQPLYISGLICVISRPNKKITAFVINS